MKKQIDAKDNKKKKKKKKSVIGRIFKFILLILLIAIIGYAAWFGIKFLKHKLSMGDSNYDPLSATALGIDPEKLKDVGRLNILLLGESDANQGSKNDPYYLTDTIMIVSYNPQTQQASILSIPRDTYVGKRDKNTASENYLASYKMNTVYRNRTNIPETLECINKLTGLELENYILVDTDAIAEIVDAIGGVWFNVPIDMNYDDWNQDLHIHLSAGEQLIDGNKAEQLLRFRHNQDWSTYSTEYGDNDIGRMRTQREFIQETAKQFLKVENAPKVLDVLDIVNRNVRTNMNMQDLKYYIPYAFKFNTENIVSDVLPGQPELCNGVWIYTADKTKTKQVIEDLFTDKVVVEEEENTNTNTVANEVTTDKTNTVETKNTQAQNTTTSSTQTKTDDSKNTNTENKTQEKITIELLNGTGDNEVLEKVKEKLNAKGYTISKSGTTTSTGKTTIINRTEKSSSISKDIKNILGTGNITSGSNNTKVDFTIIIGKDYK